MALIAKDSGSNKAPLPLPEPGTTQAVCCAVWDLGLQKTSYKGEEKIQHKVIIAWEISETINAPESEYNGRRYMLNKKYTLSLGEKAISARTWKVGAASRSASKNSTTALTLKGCTASTAFWASNTNPTALTRARSMPT